MSKIIIGVVGPSSGASVNAQEMAFQLGALIARKGWVVLTGGGGGVMHAASEGAKKANGVTVGILPGETRTGMSSAVDIAIITGMGQARNNINILSSNVVIACGNSPGTAAEIALAIKANKQIILLGFDRTNGAFFRELSENAIVLADSPEEAMALATKFIEAS